MKFLCGQCNTQYMIADDKLGKKGVRVRCKKCQSIITVRPDGEIETASGSEGDDVTDKRAADTEFSRENDSTVVAASGDTPYGGADGLGSITGEHTVEQDLGLDLGSDVDLGQALSNVLGDEGLPEEGLPPDEGDVEADRQSTRVFNAEEFQKVRAEREMALSDEAEQEGFSDLFNSVSGLKPAEPGAARDSVDQDKAEWYVAVDEEQIGPISLVEMSRRFNSGEIDAESLAWKSGFDDWLPIYEIPQLRFLVDDESAAAGDSGDWDAPPTAGASTDDQPDSDWSGFGSETIRVDERDDRVLGVTARDESDWSTDGDDEGVFGEEEGPEPRVRKEPAPGADIDWKPSALSTLSSLAEEELASLKPEDPEPEPEPASSMFGDEEELPLSGDDSAHPSEFLSSGEEDSLLSQIAAEEEEAARLAQEAEQERERQAELARKKQEEEALAAQEAASREMYEERREKVAPPEERSIPASGGGIPKWAIGLIGGVSVLVVVLAVGLIYTMTQLAQQVPGSQAGQPGEPRPLPALGANPAGPPAATNATPAVPAAAARPAAVEARPQPVPPAAAPGVTQPASSQRPLVAAVTPSQPAGGPAADVEKPDPPKKAMAAVEHKIPRERPNTRDEKDNTKRVRKKSSRQVDKPKPREEVKPKPEPEAKPIRTKPKGGLLDYDDGDDAALADELGLTKKPTTAAARPKKEDLPQLSNADVLGVMRGHLAEFKACNLKQKERDPSVNGKMVVKFTVENSGQVSTVQVRTAEFRGTYVAQCIMGVIKRLRFKESGGGPKDVPFPFTVK